MWTWTVVFMQHGVVKTWVINSDLMNLNNQLASYGIFDNEVISITKTPEEYNI